MNNKISEINLFCGVRLRKGEKGSGFSENLNT